MDDHSALVSSRKRNATQKGGKKDKSYALPFHRFPISDLEDNVLMEILLRIPCSKSVIRCLTVSRRWFRLVSSSYFIQIRILRHRSEGFHSRKPEPFTLMLENYAPSARKLLFTPTGFELKFLPFVKDTITAAVLASCDDLLLCSERNGDVMCHDNYYICNPFTKQYLALPPNPDKFRPDMVRVGLFSDFHQSEDKQGDGNSKALWSYKVVRLYSREGLFAETFSSDTGKWTELILLTSGDWFFDRGPIVHNGLLHFLVSSHPNVSKLELLATHEKVLVLDSGAIEKYYMFDCSPLVPLKEAAYSECLGPCCGILRRLVVIDFEHIKLYELGDAITGQWNLLHGIHVTEFSSPQIWVRDRITGLSICKVEALAIHQTERDIVYLKFSNSTIQCDLKAKELKLVGRGANRTNDAYPLLIPGWPTPLQSLTQSVQ